MADRSARRRAGVFRHRAQQLLERAKDVAAECDHKHLRDLAAIYERTADSLAPVPATSEGATVFTRREILRR